jgi:hypothetical protein
VGEVERNAAADIPDEIVKIPALDAAFPIPAKHRVELAGEKAGKIVNADLVRRGHEPGEHFGGRARWRVGIDFQLDADELPFGKARRDFRRRSNLQKVDHRAAFYKRRLNGRRVGFLDTLRPELETPGGQFIRHRSKIRLERKVWLGLEQREIEIFRESLQAVKNTQGTAAVKRGMVVEGRAPESEQRNLLGDLAHGVLIVVGGLGLVAVNQTGEGGMNHGVVGAFWK